MKKLMIALFIVLMMCSAVFGEQNMNGQEETNEEEIEDEEVEEEEEVEVEDEEDEDENQAPKFGKAKTELQLNENKEERKLIATLSNGRNAEVKVMPTQAAETALARLRLKRCDECVIELKEVGNVKDRRLAYEIQAERHSKLLGLFSMKMTVKAVVDAETGELLWKGKPWWAFLAYEPAQEEPVEETVEEVVEEEVVEEPEEEVEAESEEEPEEEEEVVEEEVEETTE